MNKVNGLNRATVASCVATMSFASGQAYADSGSTRWEVLGGVRYYDQEIDVKIGKPDIGPGLLPEEIFGGDDWWQGPLLAINFYF